jgi:hypothetical protein
MPTYSTPGHYANIVPPNVTSLTIERLAIDRIAKAVAPGG